MDSGSPNVIVQTIGEEYRPQRMSYDGSPNYQQTFYDMDNHAAPSTCQMPILNAEIQRSDETSNLQRIAYLEDTNQKFIEVNMNLIQSNAFLVTENKALREENNTLRSEFADLKQQVCNNQPQKRHKTDLTEQIRKAYVLVSDTQDLTFDFDHEYASDVNRKVKQAILEHMEVSQVDKLLNDKIRTYFHQLKRSRDFQRTPELRVNFGHNNRKRRRLTRKIAWQNEACDFMLELYKKKPAWNGSLTLSQLSKIKVLLIEQYTSSDEDDSGDEAVGSNLSPGDPKKDIRTRKFRNESEKLSKCKKALDIFRVKEMGGKITLPIKSDDGPFSERDVPLKQHGAPQWAVKH